MWLHTGVCVCVQVCVPLSRCFCVGSPAIMAHGLFSVGEGCPATGPRFRKAHAVPRAGGGCSEDGRAHCEKQSSKSFVLS